MDSWQLRHVGQSFSCSGLSDRLRLVKTKSTIGRSKRCDFYLDSKLLPCFISRSHATIERTQSSGGEVIFVLHDTGLNGTFVNDYRISERCVLKEGDIITFGHTNGYKIKPGEYGSQSDSEFHFRFEHCSEMRNIRSSCSSIDDNAMDWDDTICENDLPGNTSDPNTQLSGSELTLSAKPKRKQQLFEKSSRWGRIDQNCKHQCSTGSIQHFSCDNCLTSVLPMQQKDQRKQPQSVLLQLINNLSHTYVFPTECISSQTSLEGNPVEPAETVCSNNSSDVVLSMSIMNLCPKHQVHNLEESNSSCESSSFKLGHSSSDENAHFSSTSSLPKKVLELRNCESNTYPKSASSSTGAKSQTTYNTVASAEERSSTDRMERSSILEEKSAKMTCTEWICKNEMPLCVVKKSCGKKEPSASPSNSEWKAHNEPITNRTLQGETKGKVHTRKGCKNNSKAVCVQREEILEQGVEWYEGDTCASKNCRRPVAKKVQWVQCDDCDKWYHTRCMGCSYDDIKDDQKQFNCGCR